MIYLYCSALPINFLVEEAARSLKQKLSGSENSEFIEKIASRIPSAAAEGLYALEILLKMVEAKFPDVNLKKVTIKRGENGKPYFKGCRLCFNLSHSGGAVACALSDSGDVGVDIEAAEITPEKAKKLAKRFFDKDEVAAVNRSPDEFARFWTKNEAHAKHFGANLADFAKKTSENDEFAEISFHNFKYCNYPVTLCTKRNFDKVILLVDLAKQKNTKNFKKTLDKRL